MLAADSPNLERAYDLTGNQTELQHIHQKQLGWHAENGSRLAGKFRVYPSCAWKEAGTQHRKPVERDDNDGQVTLEHPVTLRKPEQEDGEQAEEDA